MRRNTPLPETNKRLQHAATGIAITLTVAAIALHVVAAISAGALWRDEANTIGLATLPSVGEIWRNLEFDSFPIVWPLILRGFVSVVGESNDTAIRVAGFAVGLLCIATYWLAARVFGHRLPFAALALLALSPSVIRWGDSLRAYGLGISLGVFVVIAMWLYAERGSRTTFLGAVSICIAAVHVIYYNATVVLAACVGAAAVCMIRRAWGKVAGITATGLSAAITLVPYWNTIQSASRWNSLVELQNYTATWFFIKLGETLDPAGMWAMPVWIGAVLLALIAAFRESIAPTRMKLSRRHQDILIYAGTTAFCGIAANIAFLNSLSYVTQPWYYLTMLSLSAVCIDAIAGVLIRGTWPRIVFLAAIAVVGGLTFVKGLGALRVRMTNADVVAERVGRMAKPQDLIVISPWYTVVSFSRYYDGSSRLITVPPVSYHRFHRYDLLRDHMLAEDQRAPVAAVIQAVEATLRSGNSVYVVGGLGRRTTPGLLPPAKLPADGWKSPQYQAQWEGLVRATLEKHARLENIPAPTPMPVSLYETMWITAARGWVE